MGPLWVDVAGYELTAEDKEILEHPTVGGLILFARNYHDSEQLQALTQSIRKAAKRPFLIGVDQEGGRVQRFREGFSLIPAADEYAKHQNGEELARMGGWLMAAELIAHDIDLSFAPVLDQGHQCKAIGNRAFGEDADTILRYSTAYMQGMKSVGMATTGKHFPGHGGVIADSHLETPYDERSDIFEQDMAIFKAQIDAGILDAMMPAHVIFPHYDAQPASGSEYWLKQVLRQQLGFKGLVFSDDLTMEGAAIMGSPAERGAQALRAGCDMLLMCNKREAHVEVLDNLPVSTVPLADGLLKKQSFSPSELKLSQEWKAASEAMKRLTS
ncbi:beta-N-acetylhexosaminidase [Vibrio alginolyticus]|jgi:beta-N-acetylhexosaminidase|uniref:Beta-hexosaminidase n=4 Tax=Vibrio harveyi group TaxID=717610 RepID=A0A1W6TNK2_VIBAL|nr:MULTISPECIES: beta-N-acetylhexosaminidase [Vibrio]EEZ83034.1 beta-N-acetylhexosaminidase [Vibrio alginolyticus 40B]MDW1808204.1 beta-N-acetylhexosaminidase [Vibrio sp. Vb2362]MDW2258786.1 beta-N-acetylhexosaminidase [Vibrio sp. 1409]NAW96219.1 beta-N-acetylhexosaminidase [Vibrio sp. V42_P2S4T144]ARO97509.1 Beta-hexosaminidase [Vibrio alginolyticus]